MFCIQNAFEIQIKQLSIDNDQLLKQIMSQEIVHIAVNPVDILDVKESCVNECNKCLKLETELLKKKYLIEKDTCPNLPKPSEKLVVVTLMNKDKRVRFAEPVTSSSNITKQTDFLKTKDFDKPLLTSTGVKPTTSASGSKPSGNIKNNRITRPPSSNQKNKVEDHSRKVKSCLNKMNFVFEPVSNAHVKHSVRNAKFESIYAICNKCLFDANHDMYVMDYVNDVNVRAKSKSKRNKMRYPNMILIYIDVKAVRGCDIDAYERRLKDRRYRYAVVKWYDLVDSKRFSTYGFDAMLEDLGIKRGSFLFSHFRILRKSLDEGLYTMEVVSGNGKDKGVVIEEIVENDEVKEASETGNRGQSLLLDENDV
ncbi:hypothetical protein Tco_0356497 [Tanacetum coccineum]